MADTDKGNNHNFQESILSLAASRYVRETVQLLVLVDELTDLGLDGLDHRFNFVELALQVHDSVSACFVATMPLVSFNRKRELNLLFSAHVRALEANVQRLVGLDLENYAPILRELRILY